MWYNFLMTERQEPDRISGEKKKTDQNVIEITGKRRPE